jgi:uncharacterized membrane protein
MFNDQIRIATSIHFKAVFMTMRDLTLWIGAIFIGGLLSAQTDGHLRTDLRECRDAIRVEMREARLAEKEVAENARAARLARRDADREMANETRATVKEELRRAREFERELRRDIRSSYR